MGWLMNYLKKLTIGRALHDLGGVTNLVVGLLAANSQIDPKMAVEIVGIASGVTRLTGEKTTVAGIDGTKQQ